MSYCEHEFIRADAMVLESHPPKCNVVCIHCNVRDYMFIKDFELYRYKLEEARKPKEEPKLDKNDEIISLLREIKKLLIKLSYK